MRRQLRHRGPRAVAQALVCAPGCDDTSGTDVIARAGTSKATSYHHFPSKESLLGALAARLAQESIVHVRDILEDPSLSAVERLNEFLGRARQLKVESAPQILATFAGVFRPENIVLYHR